MSSGSTLFVNESIVKGLVQSINFEKQTDYGFDHMVLIVYTV